jgi:hypothetical protein|tara:strand:+ start:1565 stop:1873 length:309 start_codon:yes stop_codon:yes gene_type:complete
MAKKDFPEIKEKNQGKFTKWAKNNGFKDACSAASSVMNNTKKYSKSVVKMANYAKNFGCKTKSSPSKLKDHDKSGDVTKKDFLIDIGVLNPDGSKNYKKKGK